MAAIFVPPHVYHDTPAPPLYYAMQEALNGIEEEGLDNRWARHDRTGQQLVRGLTNLGFKPFVERAENRIWHLTTVVPPLEVNEGQLRQALMDRINIEIAGGLGQSAGKILRIGTMGPLATEDNVEYLLDALSSCL